MTHQLFRTVPVVWLFIILMGYLGLNSIVDGLPKSRALANPTRSASEEGVHPVSVVRADIYARSDGITMKLRCLAHDLELIQGVQQQPDGTYDATELREATDRHAQFLAEKIEILDSSGNLLPPKIISVQHPQLPQTKVGADDLLNLYCDFELAYSYPTAPEFITIQQRMMGEETIFSSDLEIVLKQSGSDTPFTMVMPPQSPETFRFDWSHPPLPSDATEADWTDWFEKQREATLGITSFSSVYSFVYITEREVRHEILIPVASLATLIDFENSDGRFLSVEEQESAKAKLKTFFGVGNEIEIDGLVVSPQFDQIEFFAVDWKDFAARSEQKKVSLANGRVGLILSYETKAPPREVRVSWNLFNEAIRTVDSNIISFAGHDRTQFSSFLANNTYLWKSPGSVSLPPLTNVPADKAPLNLPVLGWLFGIAGIGLLVVSIARRSMIWALIGVTLIGGGWWGRDWGVWTRSQMTPAESEAVFRSLHQNLFRAFDYHDEQDVYDALATSVEGHLLRDLYLQIEQHLRMQDQGGAVAKIEKVEWIEGESRATRAGFDYRCTWNVSGTVEHWGHIHERSNQFEADFSVEIRDGAWKITRMNGLDEHQLGARTFPRKF